MNNTAIKVENLSKIYRLGEIGTGSIGQDIDRWFKTRVLGKEDPFLKIGETNDRANKSDSNIVYSLCDINFEIQQGDAVGIVGRNGAGKSTLLKVLSRVTTPTTGKINIKGRVASLLEVGTGFHPELTGRENIYLNGSILGMRKLEIDRKLDEIIDFSGVERYVDTPVKRYSSGMYVRLAFAVAAFLESEILIIDEVLAVGDAEFQNKCLGKMNQASKGEGRTVLFVSHNMTAVKNLCLNTIILEKGSVLTSGSTLEVLPIYLENSIVNINGALDLSKINKLYSLNLIQLLKISIVNSKHSETETLLFGELPIVYFAFDVLSFVENVIMQVIIYNENNDAIISSHNLQQGKYILQDFHTGRFEVKLTINNILMPGNYSANVVFSKPDGTPIEWIDGSCKFSVVNIGMEERDNYPFNTYHGNIESNSEWDLKEISEGSLMFF